MLRELTDDQQVVLDGLAERWASVRVGVDPMSGQALLTCFRDPRPGESPTEDVEGVQLVEVGVLAVATDGTARRYE